MRSYTFFGGVPNMLAGAILWDDRRDPQYRRFQNNSYKALENGNRADQNDRRWRNSEGQRVVMLDNDV